MRPAQRQAPYEFRQELRIVEMPMYRDLQAAGGTDHAWLRRDDPVAPRAIGGTGTQIVSQRVFTCVLVEGWIFRT